VQLLCRTVKLGWFDSEAHRTIVEDCRQLLERGSPAHYIMGLRILNTLVVVSGWAGACPATNLHARVRSASGGSLVAREWGAEAVVARSAARPRTSSWGCAPSTPPPLVEKECAMLHVEDMNTGTPRSALALPHKQRTAMTYLQTRRGEHRTPFSATHRHRVPARLPLAFAHGR